MRILLTPLLFTGSLLAQYPGLSLPPSGNHQRVQRGQAIGPIQVTIDYSGPSVHAPDGSDRHGHIWGELVPYGMVDHGTVTDTPMPWRAGANENTVFAASGDVTIEGQPLPAGRYGIHMIPGKDQWTIIFSKNAGAWGSFSYLPAEDALRVTVKPHAHPYQELLTYEFTTRKPTEAVAELQWEDLAVPFTIQVLNADDVYISRLNQELTSVPGFSWQGYQRAAQFCLDQNTHLEQGLRWAEDSISQPGVGQANFTTLRTKAELLSRMGRETEAAATLETTLKLRTTTPLDIYQYGRKLLVDKKVDEALTIFRQNASRFPDEWPTQLGLARGYSAKGDLRQAIEHARKAIAQAPNPQNKQALEALVKSLEAGKPI